MKFNRSARDNSITRSRARPRGGEAAHSGLGGAYLHLDRGAAECDHYGHDRVPEVAESASVGSELRFATYDSVDPQLPTVRSRARVNSSMRSRGFEKRVEDILPARPAGDPFYNNPLPRQPYPGGLPNGGVDVPEAGHVR